VTYSVRVYHEGEGYGVAVAVGPAEPRGTPFAGSRECEAVSCWDDAGTQCDYVLDAPGFPVEEAYSLACEAADTDSQVRDYEWENLD
jgi:hypothetical protein